jgi:hypothetical protein
VTKGRLLPSLDKEFQAVGIVFSIHSVDVKKCRVIDKPSKTDLSQELLFSTDTELEKLKHSVDEYNC